MPPCLPSITGVGAGRVGPGVANGDHPGVGEGAGLGVVAVGRGLGDGNAVAVGTDEATAGVAVDTTAVGDSAVDLGDGGSEHATVTAPSRSSELTRRTVFSNATL